MSGNLVLAVTDGPAGTQVVEIPSERWQAIQLRERYDNAFWCSAEAQGCGGGLIIAAGPVLTPHFRHRKDATCAFIGSESKAGSAYEHLCYQDAIRRWLAAQGYAAIIEKRLGPDGRTDLHVVIDSVRHSIEVQLSPLASGAWRARDEKYRRHHDHVTWLYGPGAEAAGATELSRRGVAFALRPGPEIGVRDVDEATHWAPLNDCHFTPHGLSVPGVEEARALHGLRGAQAAESLRTAQEGAAERQRLAEAQRERRRARDVRARFEGERRAAEVRTQQPPFKLNHDPSLARWEVRYPEAVVWEPSFGWDWLDRLPQELHPPARALAYCTQVLYSAASTAHLLPGVLSDEERRQVLDVLTELGWIKIAWPRPDLERFERCVPSPRGLDRDALTAK